MLPRPLDGVRHVTHPENLTQINVSRNPTVIKKRRRPSLAAILIIATVAPALVIITATVRHRPKHTALVDQAAHAAQVAAAKPAPKPAAPTASEVAVESQALQALVNGFVAGSTNWEIVVKDLKTGASATYNTVRSETSASFYKLYVANQLLRMNDQGNLDLDANSPVAGYTYRECMRIMINISDNTCGGALIKYLGYGAQNPKLAAQGYTHTNLYDLQETSAADVALVFERLYTGSPYLSAASQALFLGFLKEQKVNNRLPVGLPAGTEIAHKTGDLTGYAHDGGIIYGPKTDYLVVVMAGPNMYPQDAYPQIAAFSKTLWTKLEQ